jgi:hypothetical protein
LIALCCLGLSCGGAGGTTESGQAPDVLFLDAAGTTFSSPFAANLQAAFGAVTLRDFAFSAANDAASVSFHARLAAADLSAGAATLIVSNGPLADGIANAQIVGVTGVPDVDGAMVVLHLSPRTVAGTLTPLGASAPWTLTGVLDVECAVPKADLPASQLPAGGTDGAGALVADATFTAPECAPLRALAGR